MCESRGEKIVVSAKPGARMGWWVGEVLKSGDYTYQINVLSSENGITGLVVARKRDVQEFESLQEAFEFLKIKGVVLALA
jgi:hypothetical protein